jgi:hypothetical protein
MNIMKNVLIIIILIIMLPCILIVASAKADPLGSTTISYSTLLLAISGRNPPDAF